MSTVCTFQVVNFRIFYAEERPVATAWLQTVIDFSMCKRKVSDFFCIIL